MNKIVKRRKKMPFAVRERMSSRKHDMDDMDN